jgi:hypothetical protein
MNSIRVVASVIGALLALSAPLTNAAQIYKCTGNDGSVEFSNLACPPDTAASTFTVKPNFVYASGIHYSSRSEQQQPQDEIIEAGHVVYTGSIREVRRRDDAIRGGGADATLAERIREAKDADARRRALRP